MDEMKDGITQLNGDILLNKVPIHKRLKPEKCATKERKTVAERRSDVPVVTSLQEPQEKITLVERAIGYFNADKDDKLENTPINLSTKNGPPYICTICRAWFYLGPKLKAHYVLNHELSHCTVCSCLFESPEHHESHSSTYHLSAVCEICKVEVSNLKILQHYEIVHASVTCTFCGMLHRKLDYNSHMLSKHFIHEDYVKEPSKIIKTLDKGNEFYCRLCCRNRLLDSFFGHMSSYHKMNSISLLNLLAKEEIRVKINGSKPNEMGIEPLQAPKTFKNSCRVCFERFSKKVPMSAHLVYCQTKVLCKLCPKSFANEAFRDRHVEKAHTKFYCTLGCEKLHYSSEKDLNEHYAKAHDTLLCQYCDLKLKSSNDELSTHLAEKHEYKAVLMKNVKEGLFEVREVDGEKIVLCCLCDDDITTLSEHLKEVIVHFKFVHSISIAKILQLLKPKPALKKNAELDQEIDEPTKTNENDESNDQEVKVEDEKASNKCSKRITPPEIHEIQTDFDSREIEGFLDSGSEPEDKDELKCAFCSAQLRNYLNLALHLKNKHRVKTKYKHCWMLFDSDDSYSSHLREQHKDESLFECGCEKQVGISGARKHLLEIHGDKLAEFDLDTLGLKCRFCESLFWKETEMNEHEVEKHYDGNDVEFYKCCKCLTVFSNQKCLKDHFTTSHVDSTPYKRLSYRCTHCFMLYPTIQLIREHFETEHENSKIFLCPVQNCYKAYKNEKYLKQHVGSPHKLKREPPPCDICGKISKTTRAASIHRLMKHKRDKAGYQCRICKERYKSNEERKLHFATAHVGQQAFTCAECGKGFLSKSGLCGHKRIHQNPTANICPYCGKEFTRRDSYNEHLLIHVGPRHQCPHCPKSFTQRSNLTRHVRIHTGLKPYQCIYCEKRFSDQGACRSHERVHTKEEHCECSFCGKKFSKRQKLRYHMKYHTGEGLIDCEVCGKQFSNTYSLTEHRRIHNQETLVMCGCGRGFTNEKYLQRHVANVHNKGTPSYICSICLRPFFHKSSYTDHVMTHASVKYFRCLLCRSECNTKKTMYRHLKEQHHMSATDDLSKHYHRLTPEEAGLSVPQTSNIADLFNEDHMLKIDISQLQTIAGDKRLETNDVQIKEEPMSEDGNENEEETTLAVGSRTKRKVKKPVKYNPKHKFEVFIKKIQNFQSNGK